MPERRVLRSRASLTSQMQSAKAAAASMSLSRPRRAVSGSTTQSITVARGTPPPPDDPKKSIRIRFTMPSSKLREVTSGSPVSPATVGVNSRDSFEGGQIMTGPRGSRAKRPVVEESESEEEDEDEGEGDEDDQQDDQQDDDDDDDDDEPDAEIEEEEDDEEADNDDSADAEADLDADGDLIMDEQPSIASPPPRSAVKAKASPTKPSLTITPAQEGGKFKAKEMELADDDDEELSELDSEGDEDEGVEVDADAEGEEVVEMDESMDQDDENPSVGTGSRASTPDVSKMTKRQRSRLDQVMGGDFLQLPMEPQIKKHLTAEEHAMRRAEMARRRKNLSEKRNEEEKMDTINRLLKKQAPKRRGKIPPLDPTPNTAGGTPTSSSQITKNTTTISGGGVTTMTEDGRDGEMEIPKANPVFVRWVSDAKGCRVGVPTEWLEKGMKVGAVFISSDN